MHRFLSYLVVGLFIVLMPQSAFAAELIFKAVSNVEIDNGTILIEVRIDPQSKKLNVAEGAIEFSGTASDGLSVQVENGQSILPLWPTPPQYDKDKKSISFIGGVPNGFDSEGLLFLLRLTPATPGSLNISYTNGSVYLNDGKGTKESISSKSLKINIYKDGYFKISETSSIFDNYKYVIIIIITLLIIAIIVMVFIYGHKKNHKQ